MSATHPSQESPQPCNWHHCDIVEAPIQDAITGYQMGTTWVCPQCEDEDAADDEAQRRKAQEDREALARADALRTRAARAERVWRRWRDSNRRRYDRNLVRYHAAVDELVDLCLEGAKR